MVGVDCHVYGSLQSAVLSHEGCEVLQLFYWLCTYRFMYGLAMAHLGWYKSVMVLLFFCLFAFS